MMVSVQIGQKPINIILVDDDDGDAKAVRRAFKAAGVANPIMRAIDGIDALELLRGENGKERPNDPYLLLIDLNMPRMNGLQLVEKIREDPALKRSIIFILTTSKRDEDQVAAYDLNVAGYVVKEKAGQDFLNLIKLIEDYFRIVEIPT